MTFTTKKLLSCGPGITNYIVVRPYPGLRITLCNVILIIFLSYVLLIKIVDASINKSQVFDLN